MVAKKAQEKWRERLNKINDKVVKTKLDLRKKTLRI